MSVRRAYDIEHRLLRISLDPATDGLAGVPRTQVDLSVSDEALPDEFIRTAGLAPLRAMR